MESTSNSVRASWTRIQLWHRRNAKTELQSQFELGDLMVDIIKSSKMLQVRVIERIIKNAGEYARPWTYYVMASRFSRVFSREQRDIIFKYGVTATFCEVLSTAKHDIDRNNILQQISSGKITPPFSGKIIRTGLCATRMRQQRLSQINDKHNLSDDTVIIRIRTCGELEPELMMDGLCCLLSQVPQKVLIAQLNTAISRLNKTKAGLIPIGYIGERL